ncbi:major facilitator superfamily domain-containing protein 6-like [Littorina saxatilis]|uniref:Major facilitator superfamily associated domain-containing protein n=1 Tax=Littorina saxatilis TaxID=31220 RepID=A0AAN9B106_9CAEN
MCAKKNKDIDEKKGCRDGAVCVVNTTLLPLKVFNFFYFGAVGSVLPFLTVYLQNLSVTAPETGVITGVAVLVAFMVRPVLGVVADVFQSRRLLLAVCCLLFGSAFCSLWFLPKRPPSDLPFQALRCRPASVNQQCMHDLFHTSPQILCILSWSKDSQNLPSYFTIRGRQEIVNTEVTSSVVLQLLNDPSYAAGERVDQDVLSGVSLEPSGEVILTFNDVYFHDFQKNITRTSARTAHLACSAVTIAVNESQNPSFSAKLSNDLTPYRSKNEESIRQNVSLDHRGIQRQKQVVETSLSSAPINAQPSTDLQCHHSCTLDTDPSNPPAFTFDLVFFLSLTLISIARSFYSSANSLSDTVTYSLLGSNRYQWGRQRLFGTLGTAVVALLFTTVNDRLSGGGFSALFITCCCLTLLACATVFFLGVDDANTNTTTDTHTAQNDTQNNTKDTAKATEETENTIKDKQNTAENMHNTAKDTKDTTEDIEKRTEDAQNTAEDAKNNTTDKGNTATGTHNADNDARKNTSDKQITSQCKQNTTTEDALNSTKETHKSTTTTTPTTSNTNNNSKPPRPPILKNLRRLLRETAVKIFLLKILILGMFCGSAQNFIFWYLREMGSGQTVLGTCLLVNCLSTVVILRFAAVIIRRLGETRTMYLAWPAYVARFVLVSVISDPWLAVPLELLHGVTYSLLWAAVSASTQVLAPPATHATCQAIAGAVYWDLGRGLGSLLSGQLFRAVGARWTFRAYGVTAAFMLPVCVLLDTRWPLLHDARDVVVNGQKITTGPHTSDDDVEAQPLRHSEQSSSDSVVKPAQGLCTSETEHGIQQAATSTTT